MNAIYVTVSYERMNVMVINNNYVTVSENGVPISIILNCVYTGLRRVVMNRGVRMVLLFQGHTQTMVYRYVHVASIMINHTITLKNGL